MEELNKLFLQNPKDETLFRDWFFKIASQLLNNYIIRTNDKKYSINEIEFYYYDKVHHPDKSTYGFINENTKYDKRIIELKKRQRIPLTWFFHYSGVDLVFGNEINAGGILIRSIQNISSSEIFKGPLIVHLELMNQNVQSSTGVFQLILEKNKSIYSYKIQSKKRFGLGESSGKFKNKEYNFYR
jgi:hypothetical protein